MVGVGGAPIITASRFQGIGLLQVEGSIGFEDV